MNPENTMTIFDILIWGGALVSLAGLVGLLWCILFVARAKRAQLEDDALKEKLRKALPINLASLFLSVIGLMFVMVGIFLS